MNAVCLEHPGTKTSEFAAAQSPPSLIKVLHVVNGEHYAGTAKVQEILAERMPEIGYQLGFACVKPDRFPRERRVTSAELIQTPMRHRFDPRPAWMIARLVKQQGYKLLHSHTPRSLLVAAVASRLARVPLVHHVHSQTNTEVSHLLQTRVNGWLERFCSRQASKVIAVSDSIADYMDRAGFRRDRVAVVPNGVPGRWTSQAPSPPTNESTGDWTVGVVALLRPRKGLEVLLDAVGELVRRHCRVRLNVVGRFETTAYRDECLSRVEQLGIADRIEWVGFTKHVEAELTRMHCLVLPSLIAEGLPMVLIEAMASGVPIVGSDVDGIRDVIQHNSNGLLVPPNEPTPLADALQRLMTDDLLWSRMQKSCIDDHYGRFSDRSMAQGIKTVYDEVLTANPRLP